MVKSVSLWVLDTSLLVWDSLHSSSSSSSKHLCWVMLESNTAARRTWWCLLSRESTIKIESLLTHLYQRRDTTIPSMVTLKSIVIIKSSMSKKRLVIGSLLKMKNFKQKKSLNWSNSTTYNNLLLFNQSKKVKLNHPNNSNPIDNNQTSHRIICLMISNNYWPVKSIEYVLNHYSKCRSYTSSTNKSFYK